jgi:hypothetical protein
MKVGDKIRVVKLPEFVTKLSTDFMETKTVFERCLGRTFTIIRIKPGVETGGELLELEVGAVVGEADYMHSIWIEPELVELVETSN